jgi:hypothetical protein
MSKIAEHDDDYHLDRPRSQRGLFHKPQIEVVPVAVGEIDFQRPNRGREIETPLNRAEAVRFQG